MVIGELLNFIIKMQYALSLMINHSNVLYVKSQTSGHIIVEGSVGTGRQGQFVG